MSCSEVGVITEDFEYQCKKVRIYVEAVRATEGFVVKEWHDEVSNLSSSLSQFCVRWMVEGGDRLENGDRSVRRSSVLRAACTLFHTVVTEINAVISLILLIGEQTECTGFK